MLAVLRLAAPTSALLFIACVLQGCGGPPKSTRSKKAGLHESGTPSTSAPPSPAPPTPSPPSPTPPTASPTRYIMSCNQEGFIEGFELNLGSDFELFEQLNPETQTMIVRNIGCANGVALDMRIAPKKGSNWTSENLDQNKVISGIANLNFACGTQSEVDITFLQAGTHTPQIVPRFYFTLYDIDGKPGDEKEIVKVGPFADYSVPLGAQYQYDEEGDYVVITSPDSRSENPTSDVDLSPEAKARAVTVELEGMSIFHLVVNFKGFKCGGRENSRYIMFSLKHVIHKPNTTTRTTTTTLVPEQVLMSSCQGREQQAAVCTGLPECNECTPVDCKWGDWHDWYSLGGCTGLCARSRPIGRVNNECGQPCVGAQIMTLSRLDCYETECNKSDECTWEAWGQWSGCIVETDQKTRSRNLVGGWHGACEGIYEETQPCAPSQGAVNCSFTAWGNWTICSATCGGGWQSRTRRIGTHSVNGGQPCQGVTRTTRSCNEQDCPSNNCELAPWSDWQGCNRRSPMQKYRDRQIMEPPAGVRRTACTGHLLETAGCPPRPIEPPTPCKLSEWSGWKTCSATCDGGQTIRERSILEDPANGGACENATLRETAPCMTQKCSSGTSTCRLFDWRDWSLCSAECGNGVRTRRRAVSTTTHGDVMLTETPVGEFKTAEFTFNEFEERKPLMPYDQTLIFKKIGIVNGIAVDMKIAPAAGKAWHSNKQIRNPVKGGIANLDFACGMLHEIQISFVRTGTSVPMVVPKFFVTIYDIDGKHGGQSEIIKIGSFKDYVTPDDIQYDHDEIAGMVEFRAQDSPAENPISDVRLTPEQVSRSATVEFEGVSSFPMVVDLTSYKKNWPENTRSIMLSLKQIIKDDALSPTEVGHGCVAALKVTEECFAPQCDVTDCIWGNWNEWSACSSLCDGGTKVRSRQIIQSPRHGGALCPEKVKSVVSPCNTQSCWKCINGTWGAWTDWSTPSATCGPAYLIRHREIVQNANSCGLPVTGLQDDFKMMFPVTPCTRSVDCQLSDWHPWSTCSCSCFGVRERTRSINMYPQGRGRQCTDDMKEVELCNPGPQQKSPTDCGPSTPTRCDLSAWGDWGRCSATCGGGTTHRTRVILSPGTGPFACEGTLIQSGSCHKQKCMGICKNCIWGEWSMWSTCMGCAVQKYRLRSISQLPNYCGLPCRRGDTKQVGKCPATPTCHHKKFCIWSQWSDYSLCSNFCGPQTRLRERHLDIVETLPDYTIKPFFEMRDGMTCDGTQIGVDACPFMSCKPSCTPSACQLTEWTSWAQEKVTCKSCTGSGLCERSRTVLHEAACGGASCSGAAVETKTCLRQKLIKENCKLHKWTEWSLCGKTRKQSYRFRSIDSLQQNGGFPCAGSLKETRPCYCHQCQLEDGACKFGDWTSWTPCPEMACSNKHFITSNRYRTIVKNASMGSKQCEGSTNETMQCPMPTDCTHVLESCEFSDWDDWTSCDQDSQMMRQRFVMKEGDLGSNLCEGHLKEMASCENKIDCVVSDWTFWDECDALCGGGQQQRHRQVTTNPKHGGKACPTSLMETQGCNLFHCVGRRDCEVSEWSDWSLCQAIDFISQITRSRSFTQFAGSRGEGCNLPLTETAPCTPPSSRDDCQWGDWSEWSDCSCSCNGGQKTRDRHILRFPRNGGAACKAHAKEEVVPCSTQPCAGAKLCIDALWADWGEWTPCSKSCEGGLTWRSREVATYASECGKPLKGLSREWVSCKANVGCKPNEDCTFSLWEDWSGCSRTCGGVMHRTRVIHAYGKRFGNFCEGPLRQMAPCNGGNLIAGPQVAEKISMLDMTDPKFYMNLKHAELAPQASRMTTRMTQHLSTWIQRARFNATASGSGLKPRVVDMIVLAQNDERSIVGAESEELVKITLLKESSIKFKISFVASGYPLKVGIFVLRFVNINAGSYVEIGGFEGDPFAGVAGDGVRVEQLKPGKFRFSSEAAVVNEVVSPIKMSRAQLKSSITLRFEDVSAVTFNAGNSAGDDRSVLFTGKICVDCIPHVPIHDLLHGPSVPKECDQGTSQADCKLGSWNAWGSCTTSCDGGQQTRSRSIMVEPSALGRPCIGTLQETSPCAFEKCPSTCTPTDCQWDDWTEWSVCVMCAGQKRRYRYVKVEASCGGAACGPSSSEEVADCPRKCHNMHYCVWANWGKWSSCSETCGTSSTKTRVRHLTMQDTPPNPLLPSKKSCKELGWPALRSEVGIDIELVCASTVSCLQNTTLEAHWKTCANEGARVCTAAELLRDGAANIGTGTCDLNHRWVFSSTRCPYPNGATKVVMTDGLQGKDSKCIAEEDTAYGGRCCADAKPKKSWSVVNKAELGELGRDRRALAKSRKAQHVQELAVAFGCGCISIVMVLYAVRLVSRAVVSSDRRYDGYDLVSNQVQHTDVDVALE